MKKILALALALIMVLGLATTAFAAGETYSITINNEKAGHVYEAYQIFTGDLSNAAENDNVPNTQAKLANIQFAAGVTYSGAGVNIGTAEAPNMSKEAADLAYALEAGTLTVDQLLADLTLGGVDGTSGAQTEGKYVISNLTPGYYLVKDQDHTLDNKYDAYTDYIVEVVENSTVTPKSSVPSAFKYVKDTNDSVANSESDWQDSADYDIGDTVPFKVESALASNVEDFAGPYKLVYNDTMEAGLTYNDDITIKVNGTMVYSEKPVEGFTNKGGITVTYAGTSLTITIDDAKAIGAGNTAAITMEYTATLNENAIHYIRGNVNSIVLEYANDPNWIPPTYDPEDPPEDPEDPPTGKTPESIVIVYTYKLIVDKVDPEGNAVTGAGFTLYKYDVDATTEDKWVAVGDELTGAALSTFRWSGLDDGKYKLVETTTPAGYNSIDPIEFTIDAVHGLDGAKHELNLSGEGLILVEDEEDDNYGALTTDIENRPGAVLPETGGMGTTLFYVIGGLLVAAAVVLLVTKKRMASAE